MNTETRLLVRYLETHPMDAARSLERFQPDEVRAVLERVPAAAAADALAALPSSLAARCLSPMPLPAATEVISGMSDHQAAGLLRRLDAEELNTLLSALPLLRRDRLNRLLRSDENTVGALMDVDFPHVFRDSKVQEAREALRGQNGTGEFYVLARTQHLAGIVSAGNLAAAPDEAAVGTLARPPKATLSPDTECAIAVSHRCWLEVDEVPILSREGVLLGVLRHRMLRSWAGAARPTGRGGLDTTLGLSELVWLGLLGLLDTAIATTAREVRHG